MQTERKLQVGAIALLLSLVVVAGPVDSQFPDPAGCLPPDGAPGLTCAGDPADALPEGCGVATPDDCVSTDGTPCVDPEATCPVPNDPVPCVDEEAACPLDSIDCPQPAGVADIAPYVGCVIAAVQDAVPDADAEVCSALGNTEEGATADDCVQDALDAAVCDQVGTDGTTAAACLQENVPSACPTQLPGEFPQCTDLVTEIVGTAVAIVVDALAPAATVDAPGSGLEAGDDIAVSILVEGALPLTPTASIVVSFNGVPGASTTLTLDAGAATYTVSNAAAGLYLFEVTTGYEEDATGLLVGSGSDSTTVAANPAPLVDAGAPITVAEGEVANLAGTATDSDPLTLSWECLPAQSLTGASTLTPSFTAPLVGADTPIVCTLTANDGQGEASDSVTVTVEDVPLPLTLSFVFDSLASQPINNAVLVTGTVTANQDVDGAAIAIALSDANAGVGSGAQSIVWSDGDVSSIDLATGSPEHFEAQVVWDTYETVTWTVTVAGGASDFGVTFDETATYINIGAGNNPATLALAALSADTYTPDDAATLPVASTVTVTDPNGNGGGDDGRWGRIVDDNVEAVLANGADSAPVTVTVPGVNSGSLARDFAVGVTLPPRLLAGTYTLTASYTNPIVSPETVADLTDDVERSIAVANVAPVIGVAPGAFTGTARIASFGTVGFTVDDYNGGSLSGAPVLELDALALAVREASAGACTGDIVNQGLTIGFADDGGADVVGNGLDFSAVGLDQAIDVVASLAWATTALAGDFELCATLSDAAGLQDADVLLATLSLTALNGGFHLTIDDGGDGLSASGGDVGDHVTTEALGVAFTGTLGASELVLTVGEFVHEDQDEFPLVDLNMPQPDITGKLCLAAACEGADLVAEVAAVGDVVTFPGLEAVALAGSELFVVFEFDIPSNTAAGAYHAAVTLAGVEAP